MGTGDDGQLGANGACLLHHLTAFEGVGDGDEQATRAAEIGCSEDVRVGGIAGQRLDPFSLQIVHHVVVVLDDEERGRALAQNAADEAAHPAMADQHDMVLEGRGPDRLAGRF